MITQKEYKDLLKICCPFCQSTNIAKESPEIGTGDVKQKIFCNECSAMWASIYKLDGFDIIWYPH